MNSSDLTATLMFGTLGIVLLIAIVLLLRFLRRPANRHPMAGQRERNIGEVLDEAHRPDGMR